MPHVTAHVLEDQLAGHERELIAALTDAVVVGYGEWAREIAVVRLVGVPAGRWAIGGQALDTIAPSVTVGVREAAFARPDAAEFTARLTTALTDALTAVLGEGVRTGTTVDLVGTLEGRSTIGGMPV
jgi:phenylpyruvate tautomerase PptA (4-oxalocrotonate tautomerase family)